MTVRSWARRPGVERVDLSTRWSLYAVSASSEPLAVLLVMGARPNVRLWAAGIALVVAIAHTVACVALLRAGIAHLLGGPRPAPRLVALAVALLMTFVMRESVHRDWNR